jgi:hypothetical protein
LLFKFDDLSTSRKAIKKTLGKQKEKRKNPASEFFCYQSKFFKIEIIVIEPSFQSYGIFDKKMNPLKNISES